MTDKAIPTVDYIEIDEEKTEILSSLVREDNSLMKSIVDGYGKQEEKYLDGYRAFAYGLLQPLGIIAGFGFTAIGSVKTLGFFLVGEAVLIGSIIYAAFKTREAYTSTLDGLAREKDAKVELIWERLEFSMGLHSQALKEGKIPADVQEKQDALNKRLLNAFKTKKKDDKYYKFKDHLPLTFAFTAVGIILVLLSFVSVTNDKAPSHHYKPSYHHSSEF